jgi:aryl-alcohol dehydrogenase
MRITGAVLRSKDGPYEMEHLELDEPSQGHAIVRIAGTGYCHTDALLRAPRFLARPPIVTGHEGAGVVEAVGNDVDDVTVGDHVVISYDSCRSCRNCLSGHPAYCETFFERNLSGLGVDAISPLRDERGSPVAGRWFGQSSFASHALVKVANLVKVDKALPLHLLGPLGCGVQTGAASMLIALGVRAGQQVIVFGVGAVGLSAVMAARVAGAKTIVAVDIKDARLALATELGATHTVRGATSDLLKQVLDATDGGADAVLDTTGLPPIISTAILATRPPGTCGLVGVQRGALVLDPMVLATGRTLKGILEGDAIPRVFIPELIELWRQGRFPFDRLLTTFPLSQLSQAEEACLSGTVIKPVLIPSREII